MNGLDAAPEQKMPENQPPEQEKNLFDTLILWCRHVLVTVVLGILLILIVAGTSENIHSQMLKLGAHLWQDYFVMRGVRPDASCDPNPDIEARLDELEREYEQENADFDLFASEFDRDTARDSLLGQIRVCEKKHKELAIYDANFTPGVEIFRSLEHTFADIALFSIAYQKLFLIMLLLITTIIGTAKREYVAFRGIRTVLDHHVSNAVQIITYFGLGYSTYTYYVGSLASGTKILHPEAMIMLMAGCFTLTAICIRHLFHLEGLRPGGKLHHALLSVPIHSYMLLAAILHFVVNEKHWPGVSIYFTQVFQLANLHLAVGLYVLSGMLLKETLVGAKTFDVFRPWKMPPEFLAFVAILLLGYPTAYTGASGIIIIAVGAVVYQEMRRVGTRRQLSLAVTAMTGSGVVLRPCLLVVGVAIMNKEVVTDELYHWGFYVFLLSMVVFLFYAVVTRRDPFQMAPIGEALPASLRLMKPMIPYVLILLGLMLFYGQVLNTYLDEFNAPIVLPVIFITMIIFERHFSKDFHGRIDDNVVRAQPTVTRALSTSVHDASIQIGALLMLQASSFCVGGIIEREGAMLGFPEVFTDPFLAMSFMLVMLVLIGMVMDPFGALILVTGTIAPIAYASGIHPVHFWMTALMAFELGYVTPPVALNHLLARQVVGDKEVELAHEETKTDGSNFYYRNERYLLPVLVQGTTLLLVAFGPIVYNLL